ncbi:MULTISPECIES: Ger(x)C family spore germination protein [Neobacillus]|uniref:Ger(X)C family spore germination protein n=1 Tax=Neobacillus rhizophilus TaxID=2833579 RepID=A0A942U376_9BACI|nr:MULTISPECIES: Ger(x)C family spore germination protein [Neobacillus]MBS4211472.1 Ger(x)C family spore germination protein [Neobacillus rhizophilus]MBU8916890.1 Ger(x)C family spore germination protein [Bacillus sp. FJAT-29953]
MKSAVNWSVAAIIVIGSLLLTGCGFKDIDKRLFVVSIGVDLAKNSSKKYDVHLKLAVPSGSKQQPNEFTIVSEQADSMSDAVRIIKTKVDKEIDFSHAKMILIGEELAKQKGNAGIYYWLARRRDIQLIAWVVVAKPTALDVLKVKPKSEQIPSNSLFLAMGKDGSETPYILPDFLFDFKMRLIERGLDPMLPIVEAKKELFEIKTTSLFNKNHMKLTLNPEETKALNFLLNKEQKSAIWARKGKTRFFIDTQKIRSKYKIYTPKGKPPYIKFDIKIKGIVEETSRKIPNTRLAKYEKEVEKETNKFVKNVLVKIQKSGIDPIGFGLRYRSRHFNENDWEEWQKIYPKIVFKVDTKVKITDTGLIE